MTVRQSTIEDLPEIVSLLKKSIGEILTPKTEAYFSWKHEQNPFGRSKVLLAIEDEKIVGLRAFMHWRWVGGRESFSAVRAVDTATDPAFQGKGIFKKLTLQAVDECKAEGVDLVFNSPNPVSMQGYLKMGWHSIGRLPIYIGLGSFLPGKYSQEAINSAYHRYDVQVALENFDPKLTLSTSAEALHTNIDHKYLKWRYQDCPVSKYGAVIKKGKYGFVFRLKRVSRFIEFRICEAWTEHAGAGSEAKKAIRKVVSDIKPAIISCGATPLFDSGKTKVSLLFGPFRKGPVITIRPLATANLDNFEEFKKWEPSLGSIELF